MAMISGDPSNLGDPRCPNSDEQALITELVGIVLPGKSVDVFYIRPHGGDKALHFQLMTRHDGSNCTLANVFGTNPVGQRLTVVQKDAECPSSAICGPAF
ncbi:hypothetical protein T265_01625 [Opisthorchis viverrini]|uniref:Uncharacterized protein n=1 Tax=Opisthorchis viverrini TaxID=6198 RepID=A0A075A911_OPIVI|nr:hypothetical protein T265_01625 [Opisthorchis viverrini]KER32190.1 hypothetical protein T265_01625 [Opisthorchis viverrini]